MAAPLNAKFVRAHHMAPLPNNLTGCMIWLLRVTYEFWGFCLHGTNDLQKPGAVASSQITGSYLTMATGFESGSTVLLASGSDGETVEGMSLFSVTGSMPFAPSVEGKWLTMWQSGSTSTDDSIYQIQKWVNSSSISIDVSYGGTSVGTSGSKPQLMTRSNINYRVVDFRAAANLAGYVDGNHMVFQFDDASSVNVGQRNSQFKISPRVNGGPLTRLQLQLSPSGSWDGSQFVGESYPEILPDANTGPGSGGWGSPDWFHNVGVSRGYVTLIGGLGFLIVQLGGPVQSAGVSSFQVEVPERLYPQADDPNLICALNMGNMGIFSSAQVGYGFASRWFPSPHDSTMRRWPCITQCIIGSYWVGPVFNGSLQSGARGKWSEVFYNQKIQKFIMSEPLLSLGTVNGYASVAGKFSLARARLRSTRFISDQVQFLRFGDAPDRWIHAGGGVLWPWDHAVVPARPLFGY